MRVSCNGALARSFQGSDNGSHVVTSTNCLDRPCIRYPSPSFLPNELLRPSPADRKGHKTKIWHSLLYLCHGTTGPSLQLLSCLLPKVSRLEPHRGLWSRRVKMLCWTPISQYLRSTISEREERGSSRLLYQLQISCYSRQEGSLRFTPIY